MRLREFFHNTFSFEKRIFGLDVVRALAIFLVFWQHSALLFPKEYRKFVFFYEDFLLDGVSIFFVLSGFLICRILIKVLEKGNGILAKDIINFWKRRWFRTLPAYFVVLLVLIVFDYENWDNRFSFFYFGANLFTRLDNGFFRVAWSLAVEEWFYLIIPVLVFVFRFTSVKVATILAPITIILLVNFIRTDLFLAGESIADFRQVVAYRLDSIAFGGVLAWLYYYHYSVFKVLKKPFLAILMLCLIVFPMCTNLFDFPHQFAHFNLETLMAILMIVPLSEYKGNKVFSLIKKGVTFTSKISYSIYLIHASIVLWGIVRVIDEADVIQG